MILLKLKKLPLAERLNRLNAGQTAHDEYGPCLIASIKASKVTAYMEGYDEEQERIRTRMGLTAAELNQWTYRDMAACIADRYCSNFPSAKATAADLMDLLMVPMLTVHRILKERQAKEGIQ